MSRAKQWISRPRVDFPYVVRVTYLRGNGVKGDPVREVAGYYNEDGALLFEHDPESSGSADRGAPESISVRVGP
jgi:hypothetical protein